MSVRYSIRPLYAALLLAWLACAQASVGAEIDEQRVLFLGAHKAAERGDWGTIGKLTSRDQELLRHYILWPYLRTTFLRATIRTADPAEVEQFLEQYGTLQPARELRYQYALRLAVKGDLASYLTIYQQFYQGLDIAKLDCLALQAELAAGRDRRIVNRAVDLWTVGKSQVNECDSVFAYLRDNKLLGQSDYARRYALAIEARDFSLARWIAKSVDQQHVEEATLWQKAHRSAEAFVRSHAQRPDSATAREQLAYAIERITYADPIIARALWKDVTTRYRFSAEQQYQTARHIALWMARDNLSGAYKQLASLPKAAQNDEVLRWRARVSLRDGEWSNALVDISLMSDDERESEEWRYWRAVALQRCGQVLAAAEMFDELASERSYYGFLAADELGQSYSFEDSEIVVDEALLANLASSADLIRARELFLVGLEGRGRSEWDAVVSYFGPEEKRQAAVLANRWGWHSRAISTAASVGQFDDLSLRYPLPYQKTFQQHAQTASISTTWAYGITRSESLFMRDVRSSAGAVGLMQLMPATGRSVAKEISLPYSGLNTLTDPNSNIRLGTSYLAKMAKRFGGNRVLATAAYNAGPHRVERWLPETGVIDARVWIENIPFNETRSYVRRVLAAETIFHWRITGQTRRLSDELILVQATSKTQQVASR